MIKDIVVNLGLGSNDPAGDYAVSMAEILRSSSPRRRGLL